MEEGKTFSFIYLNDYKTKWQYHYSKLLWDIKVYYKYSDASVKEIVNNFEVDDIPRCPECKTKLEFIEHELWYTWNCTECYFKYRTLNSREKLVKRVKNSFERILERQIEENL